MSVTQSSCTEGCPYCLRNISCCFSRQTSDDERQPLLSQTIPCIFNSDSQSNVDEYQRTRCPVNQNQHRSQAACPKPESEERNTMSVKTVDQECHTSPLCSLHEKQEGQTCSDALEKKDSQVSSIHVVNQECRTSLILQLNQESQVVQQENQESLMVQQENQESQMILQENQESQMILQENQESQMILQENQESQMVQQENPESQMVQQENQSCQEKIEKENIKSQATFAKYENKESKFKESCDVDERGTLPILRQTIFRRSLECQYDLLDHLKRNLFLTEEATNDLKQKHRTERERNSELIDLINPSNVERLKKGLEASNQSHLVNFINKNGARYPPEDDEWPVSDCDIAPIIKSYPDLVRDLYHKSLIDHLFQNKCLSSEQKNSILSKETPEESNRELLSIMMRRSVGQLNIFFKCIGKDHAAILSQSKDTELFAVDFDIASEYRDANAEDITGEIQKILHRASDPDLKFDTRRVDGRDYLITKTKVDDGKRDGCSGPDLQSNNAVDRIQQILNEALRDDAGNIVITHVHQEEKTTGANDPKLSSDSTIMKNATSWWTSGITIVDDKLYTVGQHQSLIKVYDSHSLKPSPDISIARMKSPVDLAGCSHSKALYISDSNSNFLSIHRFDLTNNSVTYWKMEEGRLPRGLSVTAESTLLVTVNFHVEWQENGKSGVVEYTSESILLREIIFDESIRHAFHTVQLSSKQLIVSQGESKDRQHRVCFINTTGQIIKCYGKEKGKGEGQLHNPRSLAIDYKCKHIFVVDGNNQRVLVLDFDLTYLDQVPLSRGVKALSRLYFDSATDQIFVGDLSPVTLCSQLGAFTSTTKAAPPR